MALITISKSNYFHNLDYLCQKAGGKDKLMVVIKDNAYGHGIKIIAKLAWEYGIKRAGVKNLSEALHVKDFFNETLILADHPPKGSVDESISFGWSTSWGVFKKIFPKRSSDFPFLNF